MVSGCQFDDCVLQGGFDFANLTKDVRTIDNLMTLSEMNNIEISWFILKFIDFQNKMHEYFATDYAAFFLFSFTFGANHESPSTNPSPLTAQQDWMYQS